MPAESIKPDKLSTIPLKLEKSKFSNILPKSILKFSSASKEPSRLGILLM